MKNFLNNNGKYIIIALAIIVAALILKAEKLELNAKNENVYLKCITTKKEVNGKENNIITGEPYKKDAKVEFIEINPGDKNSIQNDRGIAWIHFYKSENRNEKGTFVTVEVINRLDLSRSEQTVKISNSEASNYKKLWKKNKNEETFIQINKMIAIKYLNIKHNKKGNGFGLKQDFKCEEVVKQF